MFLAALSAAGVVSQGTGSIPGRRRSGAGLTDSPYSALPDEVADAARTGAGALRAYVTAQGGAPLQHGSLTTFLYLGEADRVALHHWMDTFPAHPPFDRLARTNVWWLTIELPHRARIEYKLAVDTGDRHRLVLDPLNPRRARDPFGSNSVVTGPEYVRPSWSLTRPGVPTGQTDTIDVESDAFGETRTVRLYRPALAGGDDAAVLFVHDGTEYAEFAALTTVLDNLIAADEIRPTVAVLLDPEARNQEYAADSRHARFLTEEVVAAVEAALGPTTGPRLAMGASLGAVASLHAAWSHPGTFDGLVLQSGSFVRALGGRFRRGGVFEPVVRFMDDFTAAPTGVPALVHISCGRYDGLLAENRLLTGELRALGVATGYTEAPDGHNWENWRDRLRAGLTYVAPGPSASH